jgi:hypothetical protein
MTCGTIQITSRMVSRETEMETVQNGGFIYAVVRICNLFKKCNRRAYEDKKCLMCIKLSSPNVGLRPRNTRILRPTSLM